MSRRRFFADRFENGQAVLVGPQAVHLARVLRARQGQQYEFVHDGRAYLGSVVSVSPAEVRLNTIEIVGRPVSPTSHEFDRGASLRVTIAVALFKFDRFEWMLEKATELGMERLVPVVTARTQTAVESVSEARMIRWRRIALHASEQSRRVDIPKLESPVSLSDYLAVEGAPRRLLLSEKAEAPALSAGGQSEQEETALLVGPEGGWTTEELDGARAAGFQDVSLGSRILRSETAVLAALAVLGIPSAR